MNAGLRILCTIAFAVIASAADAAEPELVSFSSGSLELRGYLFKPEGSGPFPAVLYNHGSEKLPGAKPEIGRFFAANSYVLFVPHRRGQGRSPGSYIMDTLGNTRGSARGQVMVDLLERQNQDVTAALDFLKRLPYVDPKRIAVAGCSFGGVQTLLTAEKELGLRAAVPFAAGANNWSRTPELQDRLIAAARHAAVPVFLIQAANDYDTSPTRVLAKEMEQAGRAHKAVVYPAYGTTAKDGHGNFCFRAVDVWGQDVLAFLGAVLRH